MNSFYEEKRMTVYKSARFAVDGIDEEFPGFTAGDFWNGWACPSFTRQIAEQILIASELNGYQGQYNQETNAFEIRHAEDPDDYEPVVFNSMTITLDNGSRIEVYGIGAYYWTCTEIEKVT